MSGLVSDRPLTATAGTVLAYGAARGRPYVKQFTEARIKEPQVCELASRVRVEIDPEMEAVYPRLYAGKVTVVTKGGKRITKRVDYPKGTPENPLSKEDIESKFHSLAGAAIGRAQSESLLVEVNRTLDAETIAPLASRLGRCRITGRL